MTNTKSKIKQGMGGSRSGKSLSEKTEDLKAETRSYEGSWIKKY
jgi:hypothetical protein